MKIMKRVSVAVLSLTMVVPVTWAENFHLYKTDAFGEQSYSSSQHWTRDADNTQATSGPHAGGDYLVAQDRTLRTRVSGDTGDLIFGGDSLTLGNADGAGYLALKTYYSCVPVINNLILVNGSINASWDTATAPGGIAGTATVRATTDNPFKIDLQDGRTLRLFLTLKGERDACLELVDTKAQSYGTLLVRGNNSDYKGRFRALQRHTIKFERPDKPDTGAAVTTVFGGAGAAMPDAWTLGGGVTLELPDGFGSVKATGRGITIAEAGAVLSVPNGASALYDGLLSGPGVFTRTGGGTLTLDGSWIGGKMTLNAGVTKLDANVFADEDSQLTVASNAKLSAGAGDATFGGTVAFASGAGYLVPVDALGNLTGTLTVGGAMTVADTVTLTFANLPVQKEDGLAILRFPETSGLTAANFVLGDKKGAYDRLEVVTEDGISTLRAKATTLPVYRLSAKDAWGEHSFDSKGHWADASGAAATSAPYAGADYVVSDGLDLRTEDTGGKNGTFNGNSLTIGTDDSTGNMMLKNYGSASVTIPRAYLQNGSITASANADDKKDVSQRLAGSLTVRTTESNPFRLVVGYRRTLRFEGSLFGGEDAFVVMAEPPGEVGPGRYGRISFSGDNTGWLGTMSVENENLSLLFKDAAAFGGTQSAAKPDAWRFECAAGSSRSGTAMFGPDFTESVAAKGRGISFGGTGRVFADAGTDAVYDGPLTAESGIEKTGAGALTLSGSVSSPKVSVEEGRLTLAGTEISVSTVEVAAGATLGVGKAGLAMDGATAFADGAEILFDVERNRMVAPLSIDRQMSASGKVRISFTDVPALPADLAPVPLFSFAPSAGVTAETFEAGTVCGIAVPLVERFVLENEGGKTVLKAVFHPYVLGLNAENHTQKPEHWSSGAKAYDPERDYLVVNGRWRYDSGAWGWDGVFGGGSYSIIGLDSPLPLQSDRQFFFMPKHVSNTVSRLAFYGTAGIIAGGNNTSSSQIQRLFGLDESAVIEIHNQGDQAFYIDPNLNVFYVSVPFVGEGRVCLCNMVNGSGKVILRSDNSRWIGRLEISGDSARKATTELFFDDELQLGADPDEFDAAALTVGDYGILGIEDGKAAVIDDVHRGVTFSGNVQIETRPGASLSIRTPTVFENCTIGKTNTGRLELGGPGSGTAAVNIGAGTLAVSHGKALVDAAVTFSAGTALEISAAKDCEPALAQYGLLNTNVVAAADSLQVVVDNSMAKTVGCRGDVPLLTVLPVVAGTLADKLVVSSLAKGMQVTLGQREVSVDGKKAVQFFATCEPKGFLVILE